MVPSQTHYNSPISSQMWVMTPPPPKYLHCKLWPNRIEACLPIRLVGTYQWPIQWYHHRYPMNTCAPKMCKAHYGQTASVLWLLTGWKHLQMPYQLSTLPFLSFAANRSTEMTPHSHLLAFGHQHTVGLPTDN